MKAATTSLYTYLKQHPDIFMPKVKEPMFFNNYKQENNYFVRGRKTKRIRTLEAYIALFEEVKNEKALKEAAESWGIDPKKELYKLPAMYVGNYAEKDAELTLELFKVLSREISKQNLTNVFDLRYRRYHSISGTICKDYKHF